ncbi:MAG: glycosyltransferase family 2 protein, partial [Emcibacter sp.]|nr:glycosyltransferase family 2 protein [Emcibacter sp.]
LSKEVVIVDNASQDNVTQIIQDEFPAFQLQANQENIGFGRANNQAVDAVKSRYILLLNTDAFIAEDTLEKSIKYMDDNADCGIMGCRTVNEDGSARPSARFFPTAFRLFLQRSGLKSFFSFKEDMTMEKGDTPECDWVSGCYFLIRRELVDALGLFDPLYFMYYEEVDLCLAAKRAGWKVICNPEIEVVHIGGGSATEGETVSDIRKEMQFCRYESELLYFRKNYGIIGLFLTIILSNIADVIIIIKNAIRLRSNTDYLGHLKHILYVWGMLFSTKFGVRPTKKYSAGYQEK